MSTRTTQRVTTADHGHSKQHKQIKIQGPENKKNKINYDNKKPSKPSFARNDIPDGFSRPSKEVPPGKAKPFGNDTIGYNNYDSSNQKVGNFFLHPIIDSSPVKCIKHYIARKDGTNEFYVVKVLTRKDIGEKETTDDIQGKTLLHTEHSLLSLLKNDVGVMHEHGMFRETVQERLVNGKGDVIAKKVRRLCLVLDCYVAHDFSPKYNNITNMQFYVIKEKKLPEGEAVRIFYKVVQIVERLHKLNIVHRDLKLGNIILNKDSREVSLANFCLGKHLSSDKDLLKDQRGSPAYTSACVISGKPYLGKPSDMWSMGVILYTMLFGQFPFFDPSPTELFRKIKLGEFQIPVDVNVSDKTIKLIRSLIVLDPKKRLTASEALKQAENIVLAEHSFMCDTDLQIVPTSNPGAQMPSKRRCLEPRPTFVDFTTDIDNIFASCDRFSELEVLDPETKKAKLADCSTLSELIRNYTLDGQRLQKLHAIYVARKISEAASFGVQTVTEEMSNQSSSSRTSLMKMNATNNDSATVPDVDPMSTSISVAV